MAVNHKDRAQSSPTTYLHNYTTYTNEYVFLGLESVSRKWRGNSWLRMWLCPPIRTSLCSATPSSPTMAVSAVNGSQNPLESCWNGLLDHILLVSGSVSLGGRNIINLHKLPGGAETAGPEDTQQRPLDRDTLRAFLDHCNFRATSLLDMKQYL